MRNIIRQRLFFKINNSRGNAVRVLKFLSKQPIFLRYFDRQFSSVCLNNDTRVQQGRKRPSASLPRSWGQNKSSLGFIFVHFGATYREPLLPITNWVSYIDYYFIKTDFILIRIYFLFLFKNTKISISIRNLLRFSWI